MAEMSYEEYTQKEIKKDGRRRAGIYMMPPGFVLLAVSIIMPFISEELGLASWPVFALGFGLFFGGILTIVTNLKKKPPKFEDSMGLDELDKM